MVTKLQYIALKCIKYNLSLQEFVFLALCKFDAVEHSTSLNLGTMDLLKWKQLNKLGTLLKTINRSSHFRRSWSCPGQSGYQQKMYSGRNLRERGPPNSPSHHTQQPQHPRYKILLHANLQIVTVRSDDSH